MTSMMFWDFASLAFANETLFHNTTTSITTQLWTNLVRHSDQRAYLKELWACIAQYSDMSAPRIGAGQVTEWCTGRLGQRAMIWYATQEFAKACAPRPCVSKGTPRGCGALSSPDPAVLRIEQNFTGFPAGYRRATAAFRGRAPMGEGNEHALRAQRNTTASPHCEGAPRSHSQQYGRRSPRRSGSLCAQTRRSPIGYTCGSKAVLGTAARSPRTGSGRAWAWHTQRADARCPSAWRPSAERVPAHEGAVVLPSRRPVVRVSG